MSQIYFPGEIIVIYQEPNKRSFCNLPILKYVRFRQWPHKNAKPCRCTDPSTVKRSKCRKNCVPKCRVISPRRILSPISSLSDRSSGQCLAIWTISEPDPCSSSISKVKLSNCGPTTFNSVLTFENRIVTRSNSRKRFHVVSWHQGLITSASSIGIKTIRHDILILLTRQGLRWGHNCGYFFI